MKFKIRASQISKIMGKAKTGDLTPKQYEMLDTLDAKDILTPKQEETRHKLILKRDTPPELPEGAKEYCKQWVKTEIYGKKLADVQTKYTRKGNMVEDESILFAYGPKVKKNEEWFENEYITGTPDIIKENIVDVKNSWSHEQFPLFTTELPEKAYSYQLLGYMDLTKKHATGQVTYTLMDTPHELIEREYRIATRGLNARDDDQKHTPEYLEFAKNYQYNDIDRKYRIKSFDVEYDAQKIEQIHERVELCRQYIKTLI